jgi:hypothetical protein
MAEINNFRLWGLWETNLMAKKSQGPLKKGFGVILTISMANSPWLPRTKKIRMPSNKLVTPIRKELKYLEEQ